MNKTIIFALVIALPGCRTSSSEFDATGNFEADEVIVSSEAADKILKLDVEEGKDLQANQVVGMLDTTQLYLKKKQIAYSIRAVVSTSPNASIQLAAIPEQIETTQREK